MPSKGGSHRTFTGRPGPARKQTPPDHRPARHSTRRLFDQRKPSRCHPAHTAAGRRTPHPWPTWPTPPPTPAALRRPRLRLRQVPASCAGPWDHTQDRPPGSPARLRPGQDPLGRRAHLRMAPPVQAASHSLRDTCRPPPGLASTRLQHHLLETTPNFILKPSVKTSSESGVVELIKEGVGQCVARGGGRLSAMEGLFGPDDLAARNMACSPPARELRHQEQPAPALVRGRCPSQMRRRVAAVPYLADQTAVVQQPHLDRRRAVPNRVGDQLTDIRSRSATKESTGSASAVFSTCLNTEEGMMSPCANQSGCQQTRLTDHQLRTGSFNDHAGARILNSMTETDAPGKGILALLFFTTPPAQGACRMLADFPNCPPRARRGLYGNQDEQATRAHHALWAKSPL